MAVKVLIKRRVSQDKAKALIPLVRQMRASAATQTGYITGETLRSLDNPEEFLVISTWQSSDDWKNWLKSEERNKVQEKIDDLLGGETNYEIFHYGFSE
jgi:heme-degrading monooxygenase HmoA